MSCSPGVEKLLVVIPAYNEQDTIQQVVNSVRATIPHVDVLVIDDGSADNTAHKAEEVSAIVLRHPFNLGIGGTVQTGLKFAQRENYDFVIRIDGDGQHNATDILSIWKALQLKKADVVIGSRFLNKKVTMPIPLLRRLGIRLFALFVSLLIGHRATDTTSGFYGLNRHAVSLLVRYMPQDYPEIESRVIFHKANLATLEIPVDMRSRLSGVSSINAWCSIYYALKVSVAMLITMFKDIPKFSQERFYGHTHRTTSNGHHPQSYLAPRDDSVDP